MTIQELNELRDKTLKASIKSDKNYTEISPLVLLELLDLAEAALINIRNAEWRDNFRQQVR